LAPQTPLADLRHDVDVEVTAVADPHDDDPSLALLFSQIKSLTLQTAKGSSEVPERTEFNFVLHNARVFTRMGESKEPLSTKTRVFLEGKEGGGGRRTGSRVCVCGCVC